MHCKRRKFRNIIMIDTYLISKMRLHPLDMHHQTYELVFICCFSRELCWSGERYASEAIYACGHDREKSRVCSSHSTNKVVVLLRLKRLFYPEGGWCNRVKLDSCISMFFRRIEIATMVRNLLEFSLSWHGLKPFLI